MTTESNLGKWDPWYKVIPKDAAPRPYGTTDAYRLGAEWLRDCTMIEDWGCGMGFFRNFRKGYYLGVDGTNSPFADIVQDLVNRNRGNYSEGLFMRGVIEHDRRWKQLLANAVVAFTKRMCLVLFTPMTDVTKEIAWNDEIKVPDISFAMADLEPFFKGLSWSYVDIESDTGYKRERIFYLQKGN